MATTEIPDTHASLLAGLANGDLGYREEFLRSYLPLLYTWARKRECIHCDAEDIAQDIAWKIASELPSKVREKKCPLHVYLLTMVRNAVVDVLRNSKKVRRILEPYHRECQRREQLGSPPTKLIDSGDSPQTLADSSHLCCGGDRAEIDFLGTIDELEQLAVLADAKFRVSRRCSETEWQVYRLRCEKGMSPEDVSKELKITIGGMHNAVSKVKNLIEIEIRNWYG